MEVSDITRRIFGQHWLLILGCLALGLVLGALAHPGGGALYGASARLVLDTEDPKSQAESSAIADTAKAIATSPAQVRRALARSHATGRDPAQVAKQRITVRALGTSGVIQLTVRDRTPRVAAGMANALARGVMRVRLDVSNGMQQTLASLDRETEDLNGQVTDLDSKIDSLAARAARASDPSTERALRAKRDEAMRQRSLLAGRRRVLEARQINLLSTAALRPKPSLISPAKPPARRESSGLKTYLVLGGLLGAILGVGLAGLVETIRPTLAGSDALAAELGTPLLGTLPGPPDEDASLEGLTPLAMRLRLAAKTSAVRTVDLLPVGGAVHVGHLADRLDDVLADTRTEAPPAREAPSRPPVLTAPGALPTAEPEEPHAPAPREVPTVRIRTFTNESMAESVAATNGARAGLVVVSPTALEKSALAEVGHILRISAGPLVGLITYAPPRRGWRAKLAAGRPSSLHALVARFRS